MLVDGVDGETHYVVEAAFDAFYAYGAYPFLDAVGAGFIEGAECGDVCFNFGV